MTVDLGPATIRQLRRLAARYDRSLAVEVRAAIAERLRILGAQLPPDEDPRQTRTPGA